MYDTRRDEARQSKGPFFLRVYIYIYNKYMIIKTIIIIINEGLAELAKLFLDH